MGMIRCLSSVITKLKARTKTKKLCIAYGPNHDFVRYRPEAWSSFEYRRMAEEHLDWTIYASGNAFEKGFDVDDEESGEEKGDGKNHAFYLKGYDCTRELHKEERVWVKVEMVNDRGVWEQVWIRK